jgi:Ca2+-binding RTX toxin-like protein
VAGGDGRDRLDGEADDDGVSGGPGDDRLEGGEGDDSLSGQDGDDSIFGEVGRDTMRGGDGNDFVDAIDGTSGDQADCGPGSADIAQVDIGDEAINCETRRAVEGRR